MSWQHLLDPQVWASLLTLTVLEIVLGVDNIVFIALLANRLPPEQRKRGRQAGLGLALITRLALLASIAWIIGLTKPLFEIFGHAVSWRDIILLAGGFFLLYKGTHEIHHQIEDKASEDGNSGSAHFLSTIVQIGLFDIVFSLDSVITAVGMADKLWVMMLAVIVALLIMLQASGPLAGFIERYPTVKMLAFSFLLLIGMTLVAEGAGFPVPKGYIYAAIGFSIGVEILNQAVTRRRLARSRDAAHMPPRSPAEKQSKASERKP